VAQKHAGGWREKGRAEYTALHCLLMEPEQFDNRFIIASEFNRRANEGKPNENVF